MKGMMSRSPGKKKSRKKRGGVGLKIFTGSREGVPEAESDSFFQQAVQREALVDSLGEVELEDLEEVCVLGEGEQGVVKKMRHKKNGALYALKQRRVAVEEEEVKRSILREVKALKSIKRHPCVVSLLEAYYETSSVYLLMELVDGGSLRDILNQVGQVPEAVLGKVCKQVLQGLEYLHQELKIVHRDLKPANLLVARDSGQAKIADFGVSGHLANSLGMADTFLGATGYMSPERIKGQPHGAASDIWSLGMVILECAQGCFPISLGPAEEETTNYWAMWQKICNEEPPIPRPDMGFSDEFASFCARCLVKDPDDRALAPELLEHPWIKKWKKDKFNVSKWMKSSYFPPSAK